MRKVAAGDSCLDGIDKSHGQLTDTLARDVEIRRGTVTGGSLEDCPGKIGEIIVEGSVATRGRGPVRPKLLRSSCIGILW